MKSFCLKFVRVTLLIIFFLKEVLVTGNGLKPRVYMNNLPRVADEAPGIVCRNVLRDEQAGEDALEVLVGLRVVRRERRSRIRGVGRKEAGDRPVEDRPVEVVRGQRPLRQEHCRHRIAAHRYRKNFFLDFR